jgi:coenzyme F420-0:L-glutamate ligase/coenzyme F420-1:gamma-L-glutamate ligase
LVQIDEKTRAFLRDHRVAHLATAGSDARPVVVPICYVFDGQIIYSPLDEKPKKIEVRSLGRVRNIEANPQISIVVDDYSEDWNELAYVLISGVAQVLEPGDHRGEHTRAVLLLREKYSQYSSMAIDTRPMLRISPSGIKVWRSIRSAE